MMDTRGLIITGMQSSGTSFVAQTFFRAGLFMGRELSRPVSFNPDGPMEEVHVAHLHNNLPRHESCSLTYRQYLFH